MDRCCVGSTPILSGTGGPVEAKRRAWDKRPPSREFPRRCRDVRRRSLPLLRFGPRRRRERRRRDIPGTRHAHRDDPIHTVHQDRWTRHLPRAGRAPRLREPHVAEYDEVGSTFGGRGDGRGDEGIVHVRRDHRVVRPRGLSPHRGTIRDRFQRHRHRGRHVDVRRDQRREVGETRARSDAAHEEHPSLPPERRRRDEGRGTVHDGGRHRPPEAVGVPRRRDRPTGFGRRRGVVRHVRGVDVAGYAQFLPNVRARRDGRLPREDVVVEGGRMSQDE